MLRDLEKRQIRHLLNSCNIQGKETLVVFYEQNYSLVRQLFAAGQSKPLDALALYERHDSPITDLLTEVR